MSRPLVLVVMDYFLPAYKAGGPVRSVANLAARLGAELDLHVLTRDRDLGERVPFDDAASEGWSSRDGYRIRQLRPALLLPWAVHRALRDLRYELVYLNSFFSRFTLAVLLLRRLGVLRRVPVILAPRGELAPDALALKRTKKATYLRVVRALGLYRGLIWHATSEAERREISVFDRGARMMLAPNIPTPPETTIESASRPSKRPGQARFVFLSRIARKKNLEFVLRLLARARGDVTFDVFGTHEDPAYIEECLGLMRELPPNVRASFRGPVPHDRVHETLAGYHGFLFPTRNENFGHVVLEALLAGVPVLISNRTFWLDLERSGAGYDVPLEDPDQFLRRIDELVALDAQAWTERSRKAREFGEQHLKHSPAVEAHRELFACALSDRANQR